MHSQTLSLSPDQLHRLRFELQARRGMIRKNDDAINELLVMVEAALDDADHDKRQFEQAVAEALEELRHA